MNSRRFVVRSFVFASTLLMLRPQPALATFHFANISEVMTSYNGSADVQFVEITMLAPGQNLVSGSKLNIFDATGEFVTTALTVPSDVLSGSGRPWIMGTPGLETASGISVDFEFPNASLPEGGGMICWGKPGITPTPVNCDGTGIPYVDCIAYGTYSGPTNTCIGTATSRTPDGHSLRRVSDTDNNAADFVCADPAEPENNALVTAQMAATTPCGAGTTTTVPATSTTSLASTSTTVPVSTTSLPTTTTVVTSTTLPGSSCGDANADNAITASDALAALRTAVAAGTCALSRCDVDDSGTVSASDALRILQRAVGGNVVLTCPAS